MRQDLLGLGLAWRGGMRNAQTSTRQVASFAHADTACLSLQVFVGSTDRVTSHAEASTSSKQQTQPQQNYAASNGPVSSPPGSSSSLARVLEARADYIEESLQVPVHSLQARSPHAVVWGSEVEVRWIC